MTDNDYRIEDRFEKGRPNYTLRRLEGVYLATALWLTVRFAPRDDVDGV